MFAYQFKGEGEGDKFGDLKDMIEVARAACDTGKVFLYAHTLEESAAGRFSVRSTSL